MTPEQAKEHLLEVAASGIVTRARKYVEIQLDLSTWDELQDWKRSGAPVSDRPTHGRIRIDALEEAARVAQDFRGSCCDCSGDARECAVAIRALKDNVVATVTGAVGSVECVVATPGQTDSPEELRMVIGYMAAELQIAGDKRSTPEIVFDAVSAVQRRPERNER